MEEFKCFLKGRNRLLLMAFAIIWITFFHYALYGNLLRFPVISFFLDKGYLGVDIFFFLSAYGLCYSYKSHSLKDFYIRRLRRLYPMYLVFLIILLVFFRHHYQLSIGKILLFQISGLSSFTDTDIEWFIPALTLVYLLFPLLFKGLKRIYNWGVWPSIVLILLLSLSVFVLPGKVSSHFLPRFPIIAIGVLTFFALGDNNKTYLLSLYSFSAILGLALMGLVALKALNYSLLIPIILFSLSQISLKVPDCRWVDFVGEHTLELYLAQSLAYNQYMLYSSNLPFKVTSIVSFGIIIAGFMVFYLSQKGANRFLYKC